MLDIVKGVLRQGETVMIGGEENPANFSIARGFPSVLSGVEIYVDDVHQV